MSHYQKPQIHFGPTNIHFRNSIFRELSSDVQERHSSYEKWVNESTRYFDSKIVQVDHRKLSVQESETKFGVSPLDTISFVQALKSAKHIQNSLGKVCMLNMASDMKPGGGVEKGSTAQEEDICRRTDLYVALRPNYSPLWNFKLKAGREIKYPLPSDRPVCIYTENVTLYKDIDGSDYDDQNFLTCDCISMPAIRLPLLLSNGEMSSSDKDTSRQKIEYMLDVCLLNKCSTLVLGAFGCGAFKNNPHNIASIFKEVLYSEKYKNKFKYVLFAVYDKNNDEKNSHSNFSIFKKEFGVFKLK